MRYLFVEFVFLVVLLDVVLVALLEIFREHDVTIFTYGLHAGFLTNGVDIGAGDFVRTSDVVLKINLRKEINS